MQKLAKLSVIVLWIVGAIFFAACGKDTEDGPILVSSVTVQETAQVALLKNDTYTIVATVLPETAVNKTLQFSTMNPSVATVDATGVVTALNQGATTITIKSTDGSNKQASVSFRVYTQAIQLATPTNFNLSGNLLSWNAVSNAPSYEVTIDGVPQPETSLTQYEITGYNVLHSYQVRAKGDEYIYLSSAYSSVVMAKILSVPMNFTHEEDLFTWDAVDGAMYYEVKVNGATINNGLSTSILLDLSSPQTYEIKVRAVIEELNAYSSSYTDVIEIVRLNVPANVTQQDGGITWSPVEGATHYIVDVNGVEYETTFTNYKLPMDAQASFYTFKVKAVGSTFEVLDSVYSVEYLTQKLATPQNLRIQEGKIMWDAVSLAQSYSLELNEQIIQVGETLEFELLNNYLSGLYTIRVIANGNSTTFTSSNFSEPISASKLAKAMQVVVSGGRVTWLSVPNATRYSIEVGENKYETTTNSFDATELLAGQEYLLTVRAEAEHYIYSQPSTPLLVQKLVAPSNFRIESGLLRWDTMNYASSYEVVAGSHNFTTGSLNGYYLPLPGGTSYSVKVRSNGDNRKYLNSSYSETILANKLDIPQNLRLENGYVYVDFVENATDYILQINGVAYVMTPELFPYYLGGTPNETYNIKAMARGDSTAYLNSDYTTALQTYQLPNIENIKIENSTIYWDHIEGVSTYEVFIKSSEEEFYNRDTDIYLSNTNTFDLSSIASGTYNVKVRARGYLNNTLASVDSDELYFERLNVPQSFRVQDGLLRWHYVSNATKYLLEINGVVSETVYSELYILDESYGVGQYNIRIAAYGDGQNFITSEWSDVIETSRMEAPQNVRVVDGFVQWDDVIDATIYVVKIGGAMYTGKATEEDPILIPRFDPPFAYASGLQYFSVYAAAEGVLASNSSEPFLMNKMQAPSNLRVENKIIKWDSVLSSTGYRLFINEDVIETEELTYDLTQYASYGPGTYQISVMALGDMGDGVGNRVNSDYASLISVTVMSSPSGLSVQNGQLSWVSNNGAINYELRVYEKVGEGQYELLTIDNPLLVDEFNSDNPSAVYLLGANYPAGEYAIDIRAIGDNSTFITSDFSSQIEVVKLPTPTGLSLIDGLITYSEVANAASYEVLAIDSTNFITVNYYLNAETFTTYELDIAASIYDLSVRAVGDSTIYLTSDFSSQINAEKLETIENFRVENGILKWNSSVNASEYILNINHNDYFIGLTSSYELPNSLIQGNYQLKIKARGTSDQYLNSDYTDILNVYKMDAVTNLRVENGVLSWNGVNAPDGYTVIIINEALQETKKTLSGSATSYILPNEYLSGNYSVYVQTNGNSTSNLNSIKVGNIDNTAGFAITKLQVPANVRLEEESSEYYIKWDVAPQAQGYRFLLLKGQEIIIDTITTQTSQKVEGLEIGVHYVSVQAVGNSISLVNSNMSTPLTITQPSMPTNLAVNNGVVTWNASSYATEYRVHLVYNEVPQQSVTVYGTRYYLTDLGVYDISVQAFYSGSLPSEETAIISYEFNLFAGGNGSISAPFEVSNEQQLRNVRYNPTAHYVLTANIILSTTNFVPIGTESNPFIGNFNGLFEGNYNAIANLTINNTYTHAGLFGYIGSLGEVRNLTLTNASITLSSQYSGIVAGYNAGRLYRVNVTGTVNPTLIDASKILYAGGAVGRNEGIIERVITQVTVTPNNSQNVVYGGGITGYNNGFIYQSGTQATSSVNANYAGGVAGHNNGMIVASYNKGAVSATSRGTLPKTHAYAGGIAGFNLNDDSITVSISQYNVGAFKGGYILNSYNHGNVTATSDNDQIAYAGGIAGYNGYQTVVNSGEIKYVYSAGTITASNSYPGGESYAGGVTGYNIVASQLNYAYYLNTSATVLTNGTPGGAQTGSKTEADITGSTFVSFLNANYTPIVENQPWTSVDASTRAKLKWELEY